MNQAHQVRLDVEKSKCQTVCNKYEGACAGVVKKEIIYLISSLVAGDVSPIQPVMMLIYSENGNRVGNIESHPARCEPR